MTHVDRFRHTPDGEGWLLLLVLVVASGAGSDVTYHVTGNTMGVRGPTKLALLLLGKLSFFFLFSF